MRVLQKPNSFFLKGTAMPAITSYTQKMCDQSLPSTRYLGQRQTEPKRKRNEAQAGVLTSSLTQKRQETHLYCRFSRAFEAVLESSYATKSVFVC